MQIIVNHLTRMGAPRLCVAGIDLGSHAHVRPTTSKTDLLTRDLLRENGGPLAIGSVIDLGSAAPTGSPPEVEDHWVATRQLKHVRDMSADEYLEILDRTACTSLEEAFGSALTSLPNQKWAVDVGTGTASLAVLKPRGTVRLRTSFGKPRVVLSYPDDAADLSVADIRFYESDNQTIDTASYDDVRARLARGVDVYVMLGLSRPFVGGADRDMHWLQLNGVCLVDRPVGDRP